MKKETKKLIEEKSFFHKRNEEVIYVDNLQEIFEKELEILESATIIQTKRIHDLTRQIEDYTKDNRITMRDQFALRALEGLIVKEGKEIPMDVHDIVKLSYLIADQMLEARKKNQK